MKYYILDANGTPVHEPDENKWASWFNGSFNPKIEEDNHHDATVTTIFLGHAREEHFPVLWETMVIGGQLDQVRDKCAGDREQAEAMHARMVERVKSTL